MNRVSFIIGGVLIFASFHLNAAELWADVVSSVDSTNAINADERETQVRPFKSRKLSTDLNAIRKVLQSSVTTDASSLSSASNIRAKVSRSEIAPAEIDIPLPDGSTQRFSLKEYSILSAELSEKYPEIKTYKVRGIDTPTSSGTIDITPNGFHGFISTEKGLVYIDPVASDAGSPTQYQSYYKKDYVAANSHLAKDYSCGMSAKYKSMKTPMATPEINNSSDSDVSPAPFRLAAKTSNFIYTYRLAVAATTEYAQKISKNTVVDKTKVLSEIMSTINRVNAVFERDLAIRLILVSGENLVFTDSSTDGFTNNDIELLLTENQSKIDEIIGSDNYDVGHIFGTVGGGLAQVGAVCVDDFKAQGASTVVHFNPSNPDPFYIDIVAHELGHQFGADHSFNGTSGSCAASVDDPGSAPRNGPTAYEPGGGSTIMAYTGICDEENIQAFSDPNFHAGSIDEVVNFTRTGLGRNCTTKIDTANIAPVVIRGDDYVIPLETPFTLTGNATDSPTETLSYQWQQMDVGAATDATTFGTDLGTNPLFITYPSVSHGARTFPDLSGILASVNDPGEVLPKKARTMHFRLLVKDGNGGVDSDDIQVRATAVAGPFNVLQPNTSDALDIMEEHVIEWDTACTDKAPVYCSKVDILFSADGGASFSPLGSHTNTPNDGNQLVMFPQVTTSARIKIMCSDNIFFDVSDLDFTIDNVSSGNKLSLSSSDGNSSECVAERSSRIRRSGALNVYFLLSFILMVSGLRLYTQRG